MFHNPTATRFTPHPAGVISPTATLGFWPFLVLQCYRAGREHCGGFSASLVAYPCQFSLIHYMCIRNISMKCKHNRFIGIEIFENRVISPESESVADPGFCQGGFEI